MIEVQSPDRFAAEAPMPMVAAADIARGVARELMASQNSRVSIETRMSIEIGDLT
jgi:hypothetical protein